MAMTIFEKLPSQAYDSSNDRLVKAHMIKVTNNANQAKICDVVDLRLAAGDWHNIETENLTVEGTDGPIDGFKHVWWILNGLHNAGSSWDEIKTSLVSEEDAWI
jgi:hypothetical protein